MDMTRGELDLVILAKLDAMLIVGDKTRRKEQRQRTSIKPRHNNQVICPQLFLYSRNSGQERYENLTKHYLSHG